jgi:uncharacterized protein (DUF488 family)
MKVLYTIGHSTHPLELFLEMLGKHDITAVCDVRSSPFSRYNPQFNREVLRDALREVGIAYVFLGEELGARTSDPDCYDDEGRVRYDALAQTALFRQGLDRVYRGMEDYQVALMCAEKDPLDCHRTILVCRALRSTAFEISHILENGQLEIHSELEGRLLQITGLPPGDLFTNTRAMIERAYDMRGRKIAYARSERDEMAVPEEGVQGHE